MNERIKELFLESLDDSEEFCYQRFANIIIKECISLVSEPGPDMNDTERGILAQIKDHFGIE